MFRKVLIANRGEVALRVARTCAEMGVPTVTVYSTADRDSVVRDLAADHIQIGPPAAQHSYLSMANLLEAARICGADAIHPGYGFLSEDADFAHACAASGVTLIGPSVRALELLGDKVAARRLLCDAGLPVLDGSNGVRITEAEGRRIAREISYPVIVKAVGGGGGKAMTVVRDDNDFSSAFRRTTGEAQVLFGDGRVYVEHYLDNARHVEVQTVCDSHGLRMVVGDRDCSVQRRQQKLIEEAPAPGLSATTRAALHQAALNAVTTAGLVGLATVEFLVDRDERFYFLEVNARLQVEHGITEMISGVDLVEQQIRAAAGEPLSCGPEDLHLRGVAVECRINAEDPARRFLPTPGRLEEFRMPGGPFVRVDTHAFAGCAIPPEYDSLLSKVMVWGRDREAAITRMDRALSEVRVAGPGIHHTTEVLRQILRQQEFRQVRHSTRFLELLLAHQ